MVVVDWEEEYGEEFFATIPAMVASGKLKYLATIYKGLNEAGQGLTDLMTGANIGKAVVVIADE